MSMTIEQAKSELMQIYGALSPDKQRAIDTLVNSDMVSRRVFEQVKWERDVAIEQLKELGYGLGEKPKTGHWIENAPEYQNIDPPYICSECGHSNLIKTNYCEQCGAKMESEGV